MFDIVKASFRDVLARILDSSRALGKDGNGLDTEHAGVGRTYLGEEDDFGACHGCEAVKAYR